jgi:hypothetical protein
MQFTPPQAGCLQLKQHCLKGVGYSLLAAAAAAALLIIAAGPHLQGPASSVTEWAVVALSL